MTVSRLLFLSLALVAMVGLTACGRARVSPAALAPGDGSGLVSDAGQDQINDTGTSIWDLFGANRTEQIVNVNRYLWAASLDVLNFLPVQSVDPFTGIIVTGYGTPPGGGRAYRATVHVRDPSLDARSLNVSLHTRGGSVSPATARAVEDAILARAREMRIRDRKL